MISFSAPGRYANSANKVASKYTKLEGIEPQSKLNKSMIIMEEFNISLLTIDISK